jgi:hypothetical protein
MFIEPIMTFGTIRDSRTPKNLTPDLGVIVGVDIFSGVGSGSGLPQMLRFIYLLLKLSDYCVPDRTLTVLRSETNETLVDLKL